MPYTYLPIYKLWRYPLNHSVLVEYVYLNGIIVLKQWIASLNKIESIKQINFN